MLQQFQNHIQKEFSFLKEKKLLIAISGGIDSVVITHLLHQLNFAIALAHCNFNLREEESNADEFFVKNLGKQLQVDVFTTSFDTSSIAINQKKSIQVTARELRYHWFEELLEQHQLDYVVTAHHADDNLETFLINLTRGTGLLGFTGIPKENGNIIRPLLPFSRAEILAYAKANDLQWREDKSNLEIKYVRNKIRQKVVPILKEINPSLLESFDKTLQHLQESKEIINDRIKEVSKEILEPSELAQSDSVIKLNIQKIQKLSNPKSYLYQLLNKYNFTEWNDVVDLLSAQSGKKTLSKTHTLLKDREDLLLYKNSYFQPVDAIFYLDENQKELKKPIHLTIEKISQKTKEECAIYVDKNLISFPLQLRKWQTGDIFFPLGMKGKKKLSKYFKDKKMSLIEKENTWLLCTSKNEIIWVINQRQDRRFALIQNNTNGLKITFKQ